MDNRERDKMSKDSDVNRNTSSQIGKNKSDSSADFGQNIGRSENMKEGLNEPISRTSDRGSSGYESSSDPNRLSGNKSTGSESWDSKSKDESSSGSRH
jgi:hypothetical protein